METHDILYYVAHFSYLGIFIWFLFIDQVTPIPEELVLVTIGYICYTSPVNPFFASLSAMAGLMMIDNTYFLLSRQGNKWTKSLAKKKRFELLHKIKTQLETHRTRTLFIICFIPKVRFLMPIIAGLNKVPYRTFLLIDVSASAIYCFVYIFLGMFFHTAMQKLIREVEIVRHSIFGGFILIMAVLISYYVGKWLTRQK